MNDYSRFADFLPFVSLVTGRPPPAPFLTRIVETVVMSVVAGIFGVYVTVQVMQKDVEQIKDQIKTLDGKVELIRHDLYIPRGTK